MANEGLRLLRFAQLKERNIVRSREQLTNLVRRDGFPAGRYLSPNCRVWTEIEIELWFRNRPAALDRALSQQKRRALKRARESQAEERRSLEA
jgi:hypothetical protein